MDKSDWHRDGEVDGDDFPLIDKDGRDRNLRSLLVLWLWCWWPIWCGNLNKMDNDVTGRYCCGPGELLVVSNNRLSNNYMFVEVLDFRAVGRTNLKRWETEFHLGQDFMLSGIIISKTINLMVGWRHSRSGEDWSVSMNVNSSSDGQAWLVVTVFSLITMYVRNLRSLLVLWLQRWWPIWYGYLNKMDHNVIGGTVAFSMSAITIWARTIWPLKWYIFMLLALLILSDEKLNLASVKTEMMKTGRCWWK
jgi:hypothetical protein